MKWDLKEIKKGIMGDPKTCVEIYNLDKQEAIEFVIKLTFNKCKHMHYKYIGDIYPKEFLKLLELKEGADKK